MPHIIISTFKNTQCIASLPSKSFGAQPAHREYSNSTIKHKRIMGTLRKEHSHSNRLVVVVNKRELRIPCKYSQAQRTAGVRCTARCLSLFLAILVGIVDTRPCPKLHINPITNTMSTLSDFDFTLKNYYTFITSKLIHHSLTFLRCTRARARQSTVISSCIRGRCCAHRSSF